MRNTAGRIAIVLTALCLCAASLSGCSWQSGVYLGLDVDTGLDLVFTHDYREIVIIAADGSRPEPLFRSETAVILPRFSPDGGKVAGIDVGARNLPNSSTDVTLVAMRLEGDESVLLEFPLPQFDLDHKLMTREVVPPVWEPDGESILVPSETGIERITLSGRREALVEGDKVFVMALAPGGDRVAYSNGRNIFMVSRTTGDRRPVLDRELVPRFGNRQIYAMAFSAAGDRMAFSVGHELYVMTVATRDVERILSASSGIYWVGWIRGTDRILFLEGREDNRSLHHGMMQGADGKFKLSAVSPDGGRAREIFSQNQFDVRDVFPELSPGGRYVAFTGRAGRTKEIHVAATDGSGVRIVTANGPNRYAAWRPAN